PRPGRERPRRRRRPARHPGDPAVNGSRKLLATVTVAAGLVLTGCGGGDGGRKEVTVLFDSAVGVYETSDVLSLDASIGTVEDVELTDDHVRVVLSLRDDVPLPADVHATIEAQTVLGERNVTLF